VIGSSLGDSFLMVLQNMGTARTERVDIILPEGVYYNTLGDTGTSELICYTSNYTKCRIVLNDMVFKPGATIVNFQKITEDTFKSLAIVPTDSLGKEFVFNDAKISVLNDSVIKYSFGDSWINISYVHSAMYSGSRQVQSWNKFGNLNVKYESLRSGLYLMSNNGKLQPYGGQATRVDVIQTSKFARVIIQFKKIKSIITLCKNQKEALDIVTEFEP
jgi:hypothetical protein